MHYGCCAVLSFNGPIIQFPSTTYNTSLGQALTKPARFCRMLQHEERGGGTNIILTGVLKRNTSFIIVTRLYKFDNSWCRYFKVAKIRGVSQSLVLPTFFSNRDHWPMDNLGWSFMIIDLASHPHQLLYFSTGLQNNA